MDVNNQPIDVVQVAQAADLQAVNVGSLKIVALTRKFEDNGVELNDPSPGSSVEQAVRILAHTGRGHLLNAEIRGPEQRGAFLVYKLHRQVGTKGALAAMTPASKRAVIGQRIQSLQSLATYARPAQLPMIDPKSTRPLSVIQRNTGDHFLALPSSDIQWAC